MWLAEFHDQAPEKLSVSGRQPRLSVAFSFRLSRWSSVL